MNIELPKDLQEFISEAIRRGIVKDEQEAIVEALQLWRDVESDWTDEDQANLHQICEAIESGEIDVRDASDVFAELEQAITKHLDKNRSS